MGAPQDVWYDYDDQAWVVDGRYQDCGHVPGTFYGRTGPDGLCRCYGRLHEGELAPTSHRRTS